MKKIVYNPGCALLLHNSSLGKKVLSFLKSSNEKIDYHTICCKHDPGVESGTLIINTCAGCDKRFSALDDKIDTISIWEFLADCENFDFPDHSGMTLSIHDACPIREKKQVHTAVRKLLNKMNIEIIEAEASGSKSICCGDSLYGKVSIEKVGEMMVERAQSMPSNNVCVYCISCIKSMYIGGKKPFYLLDLLFNIETHIGEYDTESWHKMVDEFIEEH